VEEEPGDFDLLLELGHRLLAADLEMAAFHLLRRVVRGRSARPDGYRAAALALAAAGKGDAALAYFELALSDLWPSRFDGMREVVLLDYLMLLRRMDRGEVQVSAARFAGRRLAELSEELGDRLGSDPVALIVAVTWDTEDTQLDLYVREPTGEFCAPANSPTVLEGRLLRPGPGTELGPLLYVQAQGEPGDYTLAVKRREIGLERVNPSTTVFATAYLDWGSPRERAEHRVVTVERDGRTYLVPPFSVHGL